MASQDEKIAAVKVVVGAFADVETTLESVETKFATLQQAIDEAHTLGIGKQGEYLIMRNSLLKAAGEAAGALSTVVKAHGKGTEIAIREGCDVPNNYAISGNVTVMDGGR